MIESSTNTLCTMIRGLLNGRISAGTTSQGIRIAKDAIYIFPSGMIDSHLVECFRIYTTIKPVNQLRMIEDALVIYRISRAPERRIFYIDVGNLPKIKNRTISQGCDESLS